MGIVREAEKRKMELEEEPDIDVKKEKASD